MNRKLAANRAMEKMGAAHRAELKTVTDQLAKVIDDNEKRKM